MVFRWIVQTAMPCAVDRQTDNVLHTPDSPSGNSNLLKTHETRSFCFLSKHYQLVFDLYVFFAMFGCSIWYWDGKYVGKDWHQACDPRNWSPDKLDD